MSKGLEILSKAKKVFDRSYVITKEQKDIIEQELRDQDKTIHEQDCYIGELEHENGKMEDVLKIIKDKNIEIDLFKKSENALAYNKWSRNVNQSLNLTDRDFDLLKEVLL